MRLASTATFARFVAPGLAIMALAACSSEEAPTYEADATDESGGELIVSEEDPNAVPVTTPDTAMTPVPEGTETPAATPATEPVMVSTPVVEQTTAPAGE